MTLTALHYHFHILAVEMDKRHVSILHDKPDVKLNDLYISLLNKYVNKQIDTHTFSKYN